METTINNAEKDYIQLSNKRNTDFYWFTYESHPEKSFFKFSNNNNSVSLFDIYNDINYQEGKIQDRKIAVMRLQDSQIVNGSLTIPSSVKIQIGDGDPDSFQVVGVDGGLRGNQNLKILTFQSSVEITSPFPFADCPIEKVFLPIEMKKDKDVITHLLDGVQGDVTIEYFREMNGMPLVINGEREIRKDYGAPSYHHHSKYQKR